MKWNNLKLSTKLFGGFGIVLFLTVVSGIVAWNSMFSIRNSVSLYNEILGIRETMQNVRYYARTYTATRDEAYIKKSQDGLSDVLKRVEEMKNFSNDQGFRSQLDLIKENTVKYGESFTLYVDMQNKKDIGRGKINEITGTILEQVDLEAKSNSKRDNQAYKGFASFLNARMAGKDYDANGKKENLDTWRLEFEKAKNLYQSLGLANIVSNLDSYKKCFDSFAESYTKQIEAIQKLGVDGLSIEKVCDDASSKQQTEVKGQITSANFYTLLISLFAIVLGITISIYITRAVLKDVGGEPSEVAYIAKEISEGNLALYFDPSRKGVGIYGAIRNMTHKLSEMVATISNGADNIAMASQQISSGSQQMSQGASEQASSVEEVSSSMEEMTSNIQQNTDNAQQTEKIAQSASQKSELVNKAANDSVVSMKEIASKVSIIGEIAFQTNILALNAAVEAARAGEHGRGFAVVAAEVRKLAERSRLAANEIDQLSKSSVNVTEESGKVMAAIVPEIEKTAKLVQEISAASIEQNAGVEQINGAIQQLNQVTQQNAAASEELATSAEELASQADQLKDIISFFKTDHQGKPKHLATNQERKTIIPGKKPANETRYQVKSKAVKLDLSTDDVREHEFERF
jgi:methyl-accepting chemotaxis protein